MATLTFGAFQKLVLAEMSARGLSAREFASLVGVSHTTINKCVAGDPSTPSLEFLFKLSEAISIDVCVLLALGDGIKISPSAEAIILAEWITRLPEEHQKLLRAMLFKT